MAKSTARQSRRPASRQKPKARRHLSKSGGDTLPRDDKGQFVPRLLQHKVKKRKMPNSMKPEKVEYEDYNLDRA